jgi:phage terminase small subunit
MSRPRKPTQLKAIAGTSRPDRVATLEVDLPLVDKLPCAPDWMPNGHAVKEWDRLAPILMNNKLLSEGDLAPLAHLCALHGKIVQLYAAGESPTASLISTLRGLHNDFGLSPVARGKVSPTGGNEETGNKFRKNGKQGA